MFGLTHTLILHECMCVQDEKTEIKLNELKTLKNPGPKFKNVNNNAYNKFI